ncbi:ABC-three component system protein [Paenibacillus tundrae]|uniref:ABC-three component system protein n=1 Tax=Paenibacillus tundrae TaxID=528187 RepID=UPI0030CC7BB5
MRAEEVLQRVAVIVDGVGNSGSGFLIQPNTVEFSYVITAKHCLGKSDSFPVIRTFNLSTGYQQNITVLDVTSTNDEIDVTIIKVNYIEGLPTLTFGEAELNMEAFVYGFPNKLKVGEVKDKRHAVKAKVSFRQEPKIELTSEPAMFTFGSSAAANFESLSGSGVYWLAEDNISVIGMFTGFKTPDGAWDCLVATDSKMINIHLNSVGWPLIIRQSHKDFKQYIEETFTHLDEYAQTLLKVKATQLKQITPSHIIETFQEKLYLPHDDTYNHDQELWKGWLALLTYLSLEMDINKLNLNQIKRNENNLRFYFTKDRLEDVVKVIFTKGLIFDFEQNDTILINSKGKVGVATLSKESVKRIASRIDQALLYEKRIKIDQPNITKDISCLHLDQFNRKISEIGLVDSIYELEELLKNVVAGVFENVE